MAAIIELQSLADAESRTIVLEDFHASIDDAAAALCGQHFDAGLLTLAVCMTPQRFAEQGLTVTAADGTVTPAVYPTLPTHPPPLPGNATNAQVATYNSEKTLYTNVILAIIALRSAVLRACGEALLDELKGQPGGLARQDLPRILLYIDTQFSTPSDADLRALLVKASTALFTGIAGFRAEAAKLTLVFAKLTRYKQPVSDFQCIEYLRAATSAHPGLVAAIQAYETQCLGNLQTLRSTCTYAGMVAYVTLHGPHHHTTGTTGYVANAATQALPPPPPAHDHYALGYAAALEHMAHGGRGGRGGNAGRGRGGRGAGRGGQAPAPAPAPTPRPYCFVHGRRGPPGSACRTMLEDSSYTAEMQAATAPTMIDGWAGAQA
jgi:hypothetical protein